MLFRSFTLNIEFQSTDEINDALEAQGMKKLNTHLSDATRTLVAKAKDVAVYATGVLGAPAMVYRHAFHVECNVNGKVKVTPFDDETEVGAFLDTLDVQDMKRPNSFSDIRRTLVARTKDFAIYATGTYGKPGTVYKHAFDVEYNVNGEAKVSYFDREAEVEAFLDELYTNKLAGC